MDPRDQAYRETKAAVVPCCRVAILPNRWIGLPTRVLGTAVVDIQRWAKSEINGSTDFGCCLAEYRRFLQKSEPQGGVKEAVTLSDLTGPDTSSAP